MMMMMMMKSAHESERKFDVLVPLNPRMENHILVSDSFQCFSLGWC